MADSLRFGEEEQRRMQKIGIPRRVREEICSATFDASRRAVAEAERFFQASDPRPYFVIAGGVGVGKSNAAANALMLSRRGAANGLTVLVDGKPEKIAIPVPPPTAAWVHAFEIVKASSYDRDFWVKVEQPELLVVDDLGAPRLDSKGVAISNIADLLCYREAQDRKTLITANLTWEQFQSEYLTGPGERVRDRMAREEEGPDGVKRSMFLQVPGASLRKVAP